MSEPATIAELLALCAANAADRPALIGLSGAQGSGKSHHAHEFVHDNAHVAHFSMDDVYLPQAERRKLAETVHPLFATRGVPGTHDIDLALRTIERLRRADGEDAAPIPRFDKARDDRMPEALWPRFVGRPQAILIDGWCLGATAISKNSQPLNTLEAEEDIDGRWRSHVTDALARYQPFFASFDEIVYLQAPSFEIVHAWRREQEERMLGRALTPDEVATLDSFIQHYERITRAMLAGAHRAGWIVHLDEARNVQRIERRG